jgi:hypothetical protein
MVARLQVVWSLVVAALASCGPPPTPEPDAGPDASVDVAPPAAPAAPALPEVPPCEPGWAQVTLAGPEGVRICEPWPAGGPRDCPDGLAHFAGERECRRIGDACPAEGDEWPIGLPGDAQIRFVRAGAAPGGDGTRERPFGTIAAALADAPEGTIVALGPGTFDEAVQLRRGVTLWGACVAATIVTCSAPDDVAGTIDVRGADAVVRNLRVGGARAGLTVDGAVPSVSLDGVLIEGATGYGVRVTRARVVGRDVVVRDTAGLPGSGTLGLGLWAGEGARVELSAAVVERSRLFGVAAQGSGTTLRLVATSVRDGWGQESDGTGGAGVVVGDGASAELVGVAIERNRDIGLWVYGEGTEATLTGAVVRETMGRRLDEQYGLGVEVSNGARATVARSLLDRNTETGAWALDAGTRLTLIDDVVRDTRARALTGLYGQGVVAQGGAAVDLSRAILAGNRSSGVSGLDAGTRLTLADVVVRGTRGQELDKRYGSGLLASRGAGVEVARALFDRNTTDGVRATGLGTTLRLTDVTVTTTRSQELDGMWGIGLVVGVGAAAEVERIELVENRYAGVVAFGERTEAALSDLSVRDTLGQELNGLGGRGMEVVLGAVVEVERAAFERNRDVGVFAFGAGAVVEAADLSVDGTMAVRSGDDGTGLAALAGARVEADRFLVRDSALCGVMIAHGLDPDTGEPVAGGGAASFGEGEVSGNPVGVSVQTGADVEDLLERVVLRRNGRDVDRGELPAPELGPPMGN